MKKTYFVYGLIFLSIAAFVQTTTTALVTEQSSPQQVMDEIFANLYEFNYSCQPTKPDIPYSKAHFLKDLLLCGSPLITPETFLGLIQQSTITMKQQLASPSASWVGGISALPTINKNSDAVFGKACIVPPNIKIVSMGDYHGNVHSFSRNLKRLVSLGLADPDGTLHEDVMVIIKGDLGDRGHYSIETWTLASTIQKQNPGKVSILQGNHEASGTFSFFGFEAELAAKFPGFPCAAILQLFQHLPQLYLVGTHTSTGEVKFIQFCHAGIGEQGAPHHPTSINMKPLLEETINRPPGTICYQFFPDQPLANGLTWNEFYATPGTHAAKLKGARGCGDLIFHGSAVLDYLAYVSEPGRYRVCAIDRGHDHLPGGINQLLHNPEYDTYEVPSKWQHWTPVESQKPKPMAFTSEMEGFPVFTCTSCPEGFGCDAFEVITFDAETGEWIITPHVYETAHVTDDGKFRWKVVPTPATQDFTTVDDQAIPS